MYVFSQVLCLMSRSDSLATLEGDGQTCLVCRMLVGALKGSFFDRICFEIVATMTAMSQSLKNLTSGWRL